MTSLGVGGLEKKPFIVIEPIHLKKKYKKNQTIFLNSIFQFIIVFAGPIEAGRLLTDVIHQSLEGAICIAQG